MDKPKIKIPHGEILPTCQKLFGDRTHVNIQKAVMRAYTHLAHDYPDLDKYGVYSSEIVAKYVINYLSQIFTPYMLEGDLVAAELWEKVTNDGKEKGREKAD